MIPAGRTKNFARLGSGALWHSQTTTPPIDWNAKVQMRAAGLRDE